MYLSIFEEVTHEALKFQDNADFGDAITEALRPLMGKGSVTTKDLERVGLPKIINNFTNLNITVKSFRDENAYAKWIDLTKTNPLMYDFIKPYFAHKDSKKFLKDQNRLSGMIDLSTGKVYDDFAKMPVEIGVGSYLFRQEREYQPEQITAIILHELGHILTFFEFSMRMLRTNWIIQEYTELLVNEPNYERRLVILDKAKSDLGQEILDREALKYAKSGEVVSALILRNEFERNHDELGVNVYTMAGAEKLADLYVARWGYAEHQATALMKLYRDWGGLTPAEGRSVFSYIFETIIAILAAVYLSVFVAAYFLFTFFLPASLYEDLYDKPVKRVEALRKQIVLRMKYSADPEEHKKLLGQVDRITAELGNSKADIEIFATVMKVISPWGRGLYRGRKLQYLLEELGTSDLRIGAARLA